MGCPKRRIVKTYRSPYIRYQLNLFQL
jgi:hypothetical protein